MKWHVHGDDIAAAGGRREAAPRGLPPEIEASVEQGEISKGRQAEGGRRGAERSTNCTHTNGRDGWHGIEGSIADH